ncbi:MAG: S8 family serine peptidase [Aquificae bacterium]|nr:S8 family serine peptidase [Aquificota bacterium]
MILLLLALLIGLSFPGKLDPSLLLLLNRDQLEVLSPLGEKKLRVFVSLKGGKLPDRGRVILQRGGVALLEVSPSEIYEIVREESVLYVQKPQLLKPSLDRVRVVTGLNLVLADPEISGLSGKGVIVGIVDTGVDYTHPALRGKILEIHDLTTGEYCNRDRIEAGLCAQRDLSGHGTHVAGIVASGDSLYRGVAPGVELIVVKAGDYYFDAAKVVEGIEIITRRLRELGRPGVINLSLGGWKGPHDGTDLLTRILDDYAREFPVVIAAGNWGDMPAHFRGLLSPDTELVVEFTAGANGAMDLWYPGSDTLEVKITSPCGGSTGYLPEGTVQEFDLGDCGTLSVASSSSPNPENGDKNVYIEINNNNDPTGIWSLSLRPLSVSDGEVHLWGDGVSFRNPSYSYTISNEAAGRYLISVGSFVSRTVPAVNPSSSEGYISPFSGRGPTRRCSAGCQERIKPDLVAPGEIVCSSVPLSYLPGFYAVCSSSSFAASAGTSMAAPVVSGAIALMLERNPYLNPAEIKSLLLTHSREDGYTGTTPNTTYGYGKLDIYSLLKGVPGVSGSSGGGCSTYSPEALLYLLIALLTARRVVSSLSTSRQRK